MGITYNRIQIQRAFISGNIQAICGYPGIGKSYLESHNDNFIDGWFSENYYSDKKNGIVDPAFPQNYINVCRRAMYERKIIMCAMHPKAREVFDKLGMKYLVIYPNTEEKERYFKIYDERPDVREWISLNKTVWDSKLEDVGNLNLPRGCYKDEIPKGMNLTEYLTQLGVIKTFKKSENTKCVIEFANK